ncbi:MAG: TadE/TadG family type IV pilus assembly protein [Thermomicrobiales bacterium]
MIERVLRHLRRPQPAQSLVIFALVSLVLMGTLGLVLDLGYDFAQRRTLQNAADAAALAGAKAIVNNTPNTFGVLDVVRSVAQQNGIADPTTQLTCNYIKDDYDPAAGGPVYEACANNNAANGAITYGAGGNNYTGVRVQITEQHTTFVMRALGIATSGTGASATAQVQVIKSLPAGMAPFLVCGINTSTVPNNQSNNFGVNGNVSILNTIPGDFYHFDPSNNPGGGVPDDYPQPAEPVSLNTSPAGYNGGLFGYDMKDPNHLPGGNRINNTPRFLVHAPSGNTVNNVAPCTLNDSSWKGFNSKLTGDIPLSYMLQFSGSYYYTSASAWGPISNDAGYTQLGYGGIVFPGAGTQTGPASDVPGANGCKVGQPVNNCILLLPVMDDSVRSGSNGSNNRLAVRTFLAFYMEAKNDNLNANIHVGTLVKNYDANLPGSPGYVPGTLNPISIRLVK